MIVALVRVDSNDRINETVMFLLATDVQYELADPVYDNDETLRVVCDDKVFTVQEYLAG